MLDGWPRGNVGNGCRTQMIRMEAMVRHQNDVSIGTRLLEQISQHSIVELIRHRDHVVIQLEITLRDPTLPRRMVAHETVTEMIDRVVVNREEIPGLMVQQPGGGGMHAHALG